MGPVGAVRVGYIDGAFVTNPTVTQLAESTLDLVVAGTREAVMMVEAGAKILPESVMADAIAYAHVELQHSIDLQEKLAATAGKAKKIPFLGPKADSVVKLGKALADGKAEFVVFDVETTAMKPENGYIVDLAALRVQGGKVVDRFESLVNPGRSIIGHQIHGISDEDVAKAPTAAEVLTKFAAWVGDTPVVAHNVGFDLPFVLRHMPSDAGWKPAAVYDTLELAYQLYPDAGSYKLGDLVRFVFGRDHAAAHRAMPDAEATAELFIDLTNGLTERLEKIRTDIAAEIRRGKTDYNRGRAGRLDGGDPTPARHRLAVDGRAHQGDLARAGALGEHPHRRARHDHHPADQRRGRGPAPHPRLGPLHPGPDPGALDRDARPVVRRAAPRHDLRGDGEALHAPLQLPALLGRRGAPDARPRSARDRPRCARRARPAAGPAVGGGVPVRDPRRERGGQQQRLDLHGEHLRLDPGADGRRACRSRRRSPARRWA